MFTATSMLQLPTPLPSKMACWPTPGAPMPPEPPEVVDQLAAVLQDPVLPEATIQYRGPVKTKFQLVLFPLFTLVPSLALIMEPWDALLSWTSTYVTLCVVV